MAEQAYQLLRIIIIDSFWKNQVNELDLSGHTQLEGTNGAGKTSLMRLLPLFYGMRPSDIVSKVDQAKNFVDYYLPRESSMLVYEYQRPHGQVCMVLASSKSGRGLHYKFIDSRFDSKMFISDNKVPLNVAEVERAYRNIGVECSNFLIVEKYRQVIQNLRSGRKLKDIRLLQQRFSFTEQPAPHIDKVVNGTIEKNLDFDAVKQMLVAIVSDHLARNMQQEKERITLNKEDINIWLADIQASRAIQKVSDKISLWQNEFVKLDNLLTKLQHVHAEIITHQQALNDAKQDKEQTKSETREALKKLETELKDKSETLQRDINKLQADIEADNSRIELLDRDKLKYEDDDAVNYQFNADKAPGYQRELQEVNEIIEAFEGNLNKIQSKFEGLLQKLTLQLVKDQASNKQKIADLKEQANTQLTVIAETHQSQVALLNERINASQLKLNLDIQVLKNELQILALTHNNIQIDPQLAADIESNQQNLLDIKDTLSDLLQQLNQENEQLNTLERQRLQLADKHKQENRLLEENKQAVKKIQLQLLPEADSLHYFLENEAQAEGWKDNIGRVLSASYLARKDLSPQWSTVPNQSSVFGLQVDLQQLQDSDLQLGENVLREKLQAIEAKGVALTESIDNIDLQLAGITKSLNAQQIVISEHKQLLNQNELKRQQLDTQKENLSVKKQQFIKQQKIELETKKSTVNKQIKAQENKLTAFISEVQEQKLQLQNEMLEQRMVVESDRDSQLDALFEQAEQIKKSAKSREKDYKQQRDSALEELDPDGEVDKRIAQRTSLSKQIDECAIWQQKANEYKQFMNERYVHRDKMVEINQNREVQKRSLAESLSDLRIEKTAIISEKQKLIKKLTHQLAEEADLLLQLQLQQRECEQYLIEAQLNEQEPKNSADLSVVFCGDWLKQFKAIDKRLTEEITRFHTAFAKRNANSELFENWIKLVNDNDVYTGARSLFKYQNPIIDLLNSAEQKQKNTYQLVTVNANMINEFYQHIENFARRIRSIGKQLSSNVTKLAHFEALADINVNTVMKQEELEYWGPLQQFAELFEQHRDQLREGEGDIPDELIVAMQRLAIYLPSEGFSLAHHQLFDIEFTISEKGQIKHARNARQLKKISSTGLSYLAMLSLYAGILGMLRGETDKPAKIILPVDELGELAAENIDLLLNMFNDNAITMLSASPSTDRHILSLYQRHYKIKDNKIFHADIPRSRLDELLLQRQQATNNASQPVLQKESEDV